MHTIHLKRQLTFVLLWVSLVGFAAPARCGETNMLIRLRGKIQAGFEQMAALGQNSAKELKDTQEALSAIDQQLDSTDDPEEAARLKEERLRLRAEALRNMARATHEAAALLLSVRENLLQYEDLAKKALGGRARVGTDPDFRDSARRFFLGARRVVEAIRLGTGPMNGQASWRFQRALARLDAQHRLLARAVSGNLDFGALIERLDAYAADIMFVRGLLVEDLNRIQAASIYIGWADIQHGFDAADTPISDPGRLLESLESYWDQDAKYYFQETTNQHASPKREIDTSSWGQF